MSLKKNVLYSGVLTTSLYVFQFITYPYVARVLGVTNIGICNFVQSIVQYFVLFAALGTTSLGVREIAKCNGDKEKLNRVFSGITTMTIVVTSIVLLIYMLSIIFIPNLFEYRKLLYIGALQLVSTVFTIEWLFRGIEDFKFITIRNLIIRLLYVVAVFVFVKDSSDYTIYFTLTVFLYLSNAVINLVYSRNYVSFSWVKVKECTSLYFKPMALLGLQNMLTTMYTSFNVIYLGFVCDNTQIGYYTTATKIQNIILALFSAFTLVLMPRISSLLETNETEKIKALTKISLSILLSFSIPIILSVVIYAPQVVYLIAGEGYEESILLLRFAMPLIFIIGLEQIFIVQLLIPMREDKATSTCYFAGAAIGVILNIIMVPYLHSIGSVFVWFISETIVMFLSLWYVNKKISVLHILLKQVGIFFVSFLPLAFVLYYTKNNAIIGMVVVILYTHIVLTYIVKFDIYKAMVSKATNSLLRH